MDEKEQKFLHTSQTQCRDQAFDIKTVLSSQNEKDFTSYSTRLRVNILMLATLKTTGASIISRCCATRERRPRP